MLKSRSQLHDLLTDAHLWKLASSPDAFVRRAICKLLVVTLAKRKNDLDPAIISANMLTSALHATQDGSAYDYSKAVAMLSAEMPSVWTPDYHGAGKKSARSRLCYFLRKGSQGGPSEYWKCIEDLVKCLPADILVHGPTEGTEGESSKDSLSYKQVLAALHDGICNKDEPRINSVAAWKAYLTTSKVVIGYLQDSHQRTQLLKSLVLPLLVQYVRPSSATSLWTVAGPHQQEVCLQASLQILSENEALFHEEWRALSARITEDIKTSLSEQSKDYVTSQDSLASESKRWYGLKSALLKTTTSTQLKDVLAATLDLELQTAISILKTRNGKPYGAAVVLNSAIELLSEFLPASDAIKAELYAFANNDIPNLILSPSAKYLIQCMSLLQPICDVGEGFAQCAKSVAKAPEFAQKMTALRALLSSPGIVSNELLTSMAKQTLQQALRENDANIWDVVVAAVDNPDTPRELTYDMLATMTECLLIDAERLACLHGFEILLKRNPELMREYSFTAQGSPLVARLLYLADGPDVIITQKAQGLNRIIQSDLLAGQNGKQALGSVLGLITRSFEEVNAESLS